MQKQLEGTQKYINEQCDRAPYRWATHAIIVVNTQHAQRSIIKVIKPSNHLRMLPGFCFANIFCAATNSLAASTVFFCPPPETKK